MLFALVLCGDRLECTYGAIPNVGNETTDAAEVFLLEDDDWGLLDVDFVDSANALCGSLLDYGDVDYLDSGQCALMAQWLDSRLQAPCEPRLALLYTKLLDFTRRAAALGTGVVIEL